MSGHKYRARFSSDSAVLFRTPCSCRRTPSQEESPEEDPDVFDSADPAAVWRPQRKTSLLLALWRRRRSTNPRRLSSFTQRFTALPETPKVNPRERLMRVFRVAMVLVKWHRPHRLLYSRSPVFREQMRVVEQPSSLHGLTDYRYVLFDPSEYKANTQMRMTGEGRRILQKHAEDRSEQQLHYAMIALRGIQAIAQLPARMQHKLAKYGVFQSFEPKRGVVREGHSPHAFYFILYGSVIVAVSDGEDGKATTKCFLYRGDSFGELAIMNGTMRQSTVIVQHQVELLRISIETYEKVFMVGGIRNITDPDHNNFMRSLAFLQGWPRELLNPAVNKMVFIYCKRGAVMVRDSNFSKWLIIVKSGSVDVIKKLIKTKPTVSAKTGKPLKKGIDKGHLNFLSNRTSVTSSTCLHPVQDQSETGDGSSSIGKPNRSRESRKPGKNSGKQSSERINSAEASEQSKKSPTHERKIARQAPSTGLGTNKKPTHKTKGTRKRNTQCDRPSPVWGFPPEVYEHLEVSEFKQQRRTFLDDLDAGFHMQDHVTTEADRHPLFVHVQTLTKGDVFGLVPALFEGQPSLSLVSNGADCILIDKDFYLDHCPPHILRMLRHELLPFPDEATMQRNLVDRVNWDVFKQATLRQALHDTHNTRRMHACNTH